MAEWDEEVTASGVIAELEHGPTATRPCLTVLAGSATGQIYQLEVGLTTIGRANDAEIRLTDDGVSRHHARVRRDGDVLWVDDLGSRNGTFVNGQKIERTASLHEGDKLQLGRAIVLRFSHHDALDASFHERLLASAMRDPLTRLYNKRFLLDRLDSELKFARRHSSALSLVLADLDHFKAVNDGHGHLAGDAVLINVAGVLAHAVRNEDVVARFGGEELAIVLRATAFEPALALADRLRRLVEQTTTVHHGKPLRATISLGVATFPTTPADTVDQLVEAADQALYRAKHAGRNRVAG